MEVRCEPSTFQRSRCGPRARSARSQIREVVLPTKSLFFKLPSAGTICTEGRAISLRLDETDRHASVVPPSKARLRTVLF